MSDEQHTRMALIDAMRHNAPPEIGEEFAYCRALSIDGAPSDLEAMHELLAALLDAAAVSAVLGGQRYVLFVDVSRAQAERWSGLRLRAPYETFSTIYKGESVLPHKYEIALRIIVREPESEAG